MSNIKLQPKIIETDVLIIGGGAAGCFHALSLSEEIHVIIAEKGYIKRSGCLAAGVNALNAYIGKGETPESFVDYVKKDSEKIIREDLVYTIAKELNQVTEEIEKLGLPILKDQNGVYIQRGKRSIKINGENIKPILAEAVTKRKNTEIMNRLNIVDYIIEDGKAIGAYGFTVDQNELIVIQSKIVVTATGGAAGIYKPNNPGFSRHKMWYSPFNTGAGYAMGIRAGAEMTTFEMRFIALRCRDTIAPTGTIAQGIGAKQINSKGELYVERYGKPTTPIRLLATVLENEAGNGPCYLETKGISREVEKDLMKAYLNMAPAQTLKWLEHGTGPSKENVEIEGTEPYIVGGHTASGYWVDTNRQTTIKNLYAIGDVAGGSPKKYVTGCFAEAKIAARHITSAINKLTRESIRMEVIEEKKQFIHTFFSNNTSSYTIEQMESSMQQTMDTYAGGIGQNYRYNEESLMIAIEKINHLIEESYRLKATNSHELMFIFEIIDRLYVAKVLLHHLFARKETRWRCYQENKDFPKQDKRYLKYINSIYQDGKVNIISRELTRRDEHYEHKN